MLKTIIISAVLLFALTACSAVEESGGKVLDQASSVARSASNKIEKTSDKAYVSDEEIIRGEQY